MKSFTQAVALTAVLASNTKAEVQDMANLIKDSRMLSQPQNYGSLFCPPSQERDTSEDACTDICASEKFYIIGSCIASSEVCRYGETQVDDVCIPDEFLYCEDGQIYQSDSDMTCATEAERCGADLTYFRGDCYDPSFTDCAAGQIRVGESCKNPCGEETIFVNGDCYADGEDQSPCDFGEMKDDTNMCVPRCAEGEWLLNEACMAAEKPDDLCQPYEVYLRGICVQQSLPCAFRGQEFFEGECVDSCPSDYEQSPLQINEKITFINGKCVAPSTYCEEGQIFDAIDLECRSFDPAVEVCTTAEVPDGVIVDGECVAVAQVSEETNGTTEQNEEEVDGAEEGDHPDCLDTQQFYRGECVEQAELDDICGVQGAKTDGLYCSDKLERCTCGVFGGECKRQDFATLSYVECDPREDTELIRQEICSNVPALAEAAMITCSPPLPPLPGFEGFDDRGVTFDRPVATVAGGVELTLVRVTGTKTTTSRRRLAAGSGSTGPVLLTHGIGEDGSVWLEGPADQPTLPETLFDAGFDVWIFNGRGTPASRFDSGTDADVGEPQQWDFGVDEMAKEDIPAAINVILTTRQDEGSCQKVKVVTEGSAGALLSIVLNDLPESSSAYIEHAINSGLCSVPPRALAVNPSPAESEESKDMDNAGEEDGSSYYSYYYSGFDRDAYYAAFAEIRAELDYHTYHKFYYAYRRWESANYHDWWKNGKWQEGIDQALCEVKPSDMRCIPADLTDLIDFSNAIEELGIVSICGAEWTSDDVTAVCEKTGEENWQCQQLKLATCGDGGLSTETFLTVLQQSYLQSWAKYNPDFSTNGWFTAAETYSTDSINVPVYNWFAQAGSCPAELNKEIGDSIPTQSSRLTFTNGVGDDSPGFTSGGASYNALLCNILASANTDIDGACGALSFGEWK